MAWGFSPGCACCNPCTLCDGGVPQKLQLQLPDFFNVVGTGIVCCGDLKGSYLLDFVGNDPTYVTSFVIQLATFVNSPFMDIIFIHSSGNQFPVFAKSFASNPVCTGWDNLVVPRSGVAIADCTATDPALVSAAA